MTGLEVCESIFTEPGFDDEGWSLYKFLVPVSSRYLLAHHKKYWKISCLLPILSVMIHWKYIEYRRMGNKVFEINAIILYNTHFGVLYRTAKQLVKTVTDCRT